MKNYIIPVFFILVSILSCKPSFSEDIRSIQKCSNSKISKLNQSSSLDHEIDFYKAMLDMETVFITNNLLSGTSKKSYKKLIANMENKSIPLTGIDTTYNQLNESLKSNKLYDLHGSVFNLIFNCFEHAIFLNKDLENTAIGKQKESADKMYLTGGLFFIKEDLNALIDAVSAQDFEQQIIYRSSLLLSIYDNMEESIHPTPPSYRDK